jgi:hypothetical protein
VFLRKRFFMSKIPTADLQDSKVDEKVVLSGLWVSTLFVFAYVDIFGFWRADIIQGALAGEVPGVGFSINQRFLSLTTVYILVPRTGLPTSSSAWSTWPPSWGISSAKPGSTTSSGASSRWRFSSPSRGSPGAGGGGPFTSSPPPISPGLLGR